MRIGKEDNKPFMCKRYEFLYKISLKNLLNEGTPDKRHRRDSVFQYPHACNQRTQLLITKGPSPSILFYGWNQWSRGRPERMKDSGPFMRTNAQILGFTESVRTNVSHPPYSKLNACGNGNFRQKILLIILSFPHLFTKFQWEIRIN